MHANRWSHFFLCLFCSLALIFVFLNSHLDLKLIDWESPRPSLKTKSIKSNVIENYFTLRNISSNVRLLLIDTDALLEMILDPGKSLRAPLKLAVDERDFKVLDEKISSSHEIIQFRDDPKKDYFEFFEREGQSRIMPRYPFYSVGNVFFPVYIRLFLKLWESSRKINCKHLHINRGKKDQRRLIPLKAIEDLAAYRDILYSHEMRPFLNGGTLLGWYRECSIIPHTKDVDLAVKEYEFNDQLIKYLKRKPPDFRLRRLLGMRNDSMELTVKSRRYGLMIDLFLMYEEGESSWVGGTDRTLRKYRYTYPRFSKFCSADLLGHAFLIHCDPEKIIEIEYGSDWTNDHPTRLFSWNSSHKNVKPASKWKEKYRTSVYQLYPND